jgi:hypothetical protein
VRPSELIENRRSDDRRAIIEAMLDEVSRAR